MRKRQVFLAPVLTGIILSFGSAHALAARKTCAGEAIGIMSASLIMNTARQPEFAEILLKEHQDGLEEIKSHRLSRDSCPAAGLAIACQSLLESTARQPSLMTRLVELYKNYCKPEIVALPMPLANKDLVKRIGEVWASYMESIARQPEAMEKLKSIKDMCVSDIKGLEEQDFPWVWIGENEDDD